MEPSLLNNIRVVLVEPSHPGNIGAVARAMKTMGLLRLVLVSPKQFPSAEATSRASGADDVLHVAEVVETYREALRGCGLVLGTSARSRTIVWPQLNPRQCAELAVAHAADSDIALVFGREHSGLTNEELDHCHYLVQIPANPDYSSLNLGAAVQVLAYELRAAVLSVKEIKPVAEARDRLATAEEMEGFMGHLEEVAHGLGFLNPAQPRLLMRRLRRLFNRAQLEKAEVNILRGFLKAVQQATHDKRGA